MTRPAMTRLAAALILAVAAAALVTACGGGSSSTGATEAAPKPGGKPDGEGTKIAWLDFGFGNSFSGASLAAAREEAAGLNVSLEAFDGKFDPANQAAQCQDAVTSGRFAAIVAGPISGVALVPCAAEAEAAGIPIVAHGDAVGAESESKVPTEPGVVANVFTPVAILYDAVPKAVEQACKSLDPCAVVFLDDLKEQPEAAAVYKEKLEEAEEADPSIEIVADPEAGNEVSTGQTAMQDILAKGTDVDLVTGIPAQAMKGATLALKSAGKTLAAKGEGIRILAVGATTQQIAAIDQGEYWGAVITLPVTEGKRSVEVATEAALGETYPKSIVPPQVENLPFVLSVLNKSEWAGFKGQWSE